MAKRIYAPILHFTMHNKLAVLCFAAIVLIVAFGLMAPNLGSEFVPQLSEGAIAINVVRLAGTSLEESLENNTRIERLVLEAFPDEVAHVWSRIGSAEIATDPMGVELSDIFITLKPREVWKKAATQAELTAQVEELLKDFAGPKFAFTQPIKLRMDEIATGSRADVSVKVFGDDYDQLRTTAQEVEAVLQTIPGAADVALDSPTNQTVLQIRVKQDEIARYGIPAQEILELVEAIGGIEVGEINEGQMRFPLVVRLPEKVRTDPVTIGAIRVATPAGEQIPLSRLADIQTVEGPSEIIREWGQRRRNVSVNVRGRDIGSFVAEAQRRVAEEVALPGSRYHIEWGGQFEHLIRARQRLMLVVPLALFLIFVLLYLTYNNAIDALRVFTGVPFAWTGGIFALWLRDMPFSISAAIGFVALSGVAVLDDMLLVSYIRQLRSRGVPLEPAVEQAAMTRLRPVLMTSLVAALGFVPMAFNTGMGAEVQRPLATVVIGGVSSAMVMSLLVLRVLYMVVRSPVERIAEPSTAQSTKEKSIVELVEIQ